MSKEQRQVEAVEALLDQIMAASGFGYDEEFVTVSVGLIRMALRVVEAAWDLEHLAGICPECEAGKHGNCLGEALNSTDEIDVCRCEAQGHGE